MYSSSVQRDCVARTELIISNALTREKTYKLITKRRALFQVPRLVKIDHPILNECVPSRTVAINYLQKQRKNLSVKSCEIISILDLLRQLMV